MLRIHFTAEDLNRTRLLDTWGPLGETFFSLTTLQQPAAWSPFEGWRRRVQRDRGARVHPASALFHEGLIDFFTLTGPGRSLDEGLEALRAAGSAHMRDELEGAVEARARYGGCTEQWSGTQWGDPAHDRGDREELVGFLRDYHQLAVAPYWSRIAPRLRAEQASHARNLATGGVEAMLAGLPPGFRWRTPVLEIGRGALTGEVKLEGRGLTLVPSAFCQTRPITYTDAIDDQAPMVLFIPVIRTVSDAAALFTTPADGSLKALSALLGTTRAHTLDAIGEGPCTTGELARRLGVSSATASEHATVLRQTGLITTIRHGSSVLHSLTDLGTALLNGHTSLTQT